MADSSMPCFDWLLLPKDFMWLFIFVRVKKQNKRGKYGRHNREETNGVDKSDW
jgi:hypothetical protein